MPRLSARIADARNTARDHGRTACIAMLVACAPALGARILRAARPPLDPSPDAPARPAEGDAPPAWTAPDAGERARREAAERDFVADASHELRSPLTSIKGYVELLEGTELTERQREWLSIVSLSTERLVALVDDLLDITRMEAGRMELRRRATDVPGLVSETARLLSAQMAERGQHFETSEPAELSRALVDPNRLRQILVNLLTNAHLYSGEGGRIAVELLEEERALVVRVVNSGPGMTAEEAAHVFDRFSRGAGASGHDGTGLGLAIAHSLVELHRGTIRVTSAPNEGATFEVRLPGAMGIEHVAPRGHGRERLSGRHVLVVDDDPQVAALIAAHLTETGATSRSVHSGVDALAALREEPFDAATLDILMPGMSGFELLRALRADSELEATPVVVVSVFTGREALSGEWFVPKPIDAEALTDALGAAIMTQRIRVLAVGPPASRPALDRALRVLGIEHDWACDAAEAAAMCRARHYEVALLDAGLAAPHTILDALELRGRRLRHAVLVFSGDGADPGPAWRGTEPVAVGDAGAAVIGLLAPTPDELVAE